MREEIIFAFAMLGFALALFIVIALVLIWKLVVLDDTLNNEMPTQCRHANRKFIYKSPNSLYKKEVCIECGEPLYVSLGKEL